MSTTLLIAAATLAIATGLAHSIGGELLIFRHLRRDGLVPKTDCPPLKERHVRILWATWHLASVFGWAFAALLLHAALASEVHGFTYVVLLAAAWANLVGSLLVLVGTKGRHPGWIALLLVAALVWLATNGPA